MMPPEPGWLGRLVNDYDRRRIKAKNVLRLLGIHSFDISSADSDSKVFQRIVKRFRGRDDALSVIEYRQWRSARARQRNRRRQVIDELDLGTRNDR